MENDCWKQPLKEFHKIANSKTHNAISSPYFSAVHTVGVERCNEIICRLIIISGMNKQEKRTKRISDEASAVIVIFKWCVCFLFLLNSAFGVCAVAYKESTRNTTVPIRLHLFDLRSEVCISVLVLPVSFDF